MSLKYYLIVMSAATIIAYIVFVSVIFYFDPFTAGTVPIILFYAALSLALVGSFSIMGFLIRYFFTPSVIVFREVVTSFRQAILLATVIVVSLILKQFDIFNFATILLLIAALAILELIFVNRNPGSKILTL